MEDQNIIEKACLRAVWRRIDRIGGVGSMCRDTVENICVDVVTDRMNKYLSSPEFDQLVDRIAQGIEDIAQEVSEDPTPERYPKIKV